jgi:hypothetical protein
VVVQLSLKHDLLLSVNLLSQWVWKELLQLETIYARNLLKECIAL